VVATLTPTELDPSRVDEAAALVAREHAAARADLPLLPVAYADPAHCATALEGLLAEGHRGVVVTEAGRCVGVMCGRAQRGAAFLPADGVAVDPAVADPTRVAVRLFAELAPVLLVDGALRYLVNHLALPRLSEAFADVGFGRGSVFGSQPARATTATPGVEVRIGTAADLDVIAELSQVELRHRSTPPIYAPPLPNTRADTRERHRGLLEAGAVHLLARVGGRDVGLLTLEPDSPVPRLCPEGQPYIGPTATRAEERGRGVGHALVDAALDWAHRHDMATVSVDFDSPNPLSRPFWTGSGFATVGYGVRRTLDPSVSALGAKPPQNDAIA
jgi:GNAT superfamily N-acetyltransferase